MPPTQRRRSCRQLAAVGLNGVYITLSGSVTPLAAEDIAGKVIDGLTSAPLAFVSVSVLDSTARRAGTSVTNSLGMFRVSGLGSDPHAVIFSRLGYVDRLLDGVNPGGDESSTIAVALTPTAYTLDPIVVTASRRRETNLRAPASTTVVPRATIEERVMFTPVDVVRSVPGMDFASKGLTQHTFAARGDRSVNSGALLVLADHRLASVPSIGFNVSYLIAPTSDDIERIEVIRGPGAALYGPNTDQGVLHIITRSPFVNPGTHLALSVGERSVFQTSFRHSRLLGETLAAKISAEHFRGNDWEAADPVEQARREEELNGGALADTLLTGRRDFDIERIAATARIDWLPAERTVVIAQGGLAQSVNNVDLTQNGAVQVRDWRYSYLQVKAEHEESSANFTFNLNDAGDSYFLRTGRPLVDTSRLWAMQLQHGADLGERSVLQVGVDGRLTDPRTGGTVHGSNEDDDTMIELGTYLHSAIGVHERLDLVAAVRADHHDRIDDLAVSPRLGVVWEPMSSHALRLVYNRAFNSPSAIDLFIDVSAGSLGPYEVRLSGIPRDGFTFSRDCGDLCMRVPGISASLPADATLTWDTIVALLLDAGVDLRDIPPPTRMDVGTDLKSLDLAGGRFLAIDESDVKDLPSLRRTITNAMEMGYKGRINDRIAIDLDAYVRRISDGTGSFVAATPSVFYDQESLQEYLGEYMEDDVAAFVADTISTVPVGTVAPDEAGDAADILLITRQGGTYTNWGADVGVEVNLTDRIWVGSNYSWLRRNTIDGVDDIGVVVLGVPKNKAALSAGVREAGRGVSGSVRGRWVESFPVANGVYLGRVDSYVVCDLSLVYRLPSFRNARLSVDARNLFDARHQEIAGAPELGRVTVARVQVEL